MTTLSVRQAFARFTFILTLGAIIATGSLAVGEVSDATAKPRISCEVAMELAYIHFTHANVFDALGNDAMYWYHTGIGTAYLNSC